MNSRYLFLAIASFFSITGYSKPAILLVEEGVLARGARAIESLKDYEFVVPQDALFLQMNQCTSDDADEKTLEISKAVADASSLFYEHAAFKPSEEKLRWVLSQMNDWACVGIGNERFLKKVFSGAVLLVRILLARNSPDAEEVASLVFSKFWYLSLTEIDIPPDVRDFLENHSRKERKKVEILQKGDEELVVAIDGNIVGQGKVVQASCPEGERTIAFVSRKGKVYTGRIRVAGDEETVFVYEPLLRQGFSLGEKSIVLPSERLEKTAHDLSSFIKIPVVVIEARGEGQVAFEYSHDSEKKEVLDLEPEQTVVAPVHERTNLRTWGYAIGGIAAAFLGAGIALNVMANQQVSDINSGQNHISRYNRYKWASIACYAGAGASGVTSLLLILLKKSSVKPQVYNRGIAVSFEF
jgi:hypothetical protein